MDKREWLLHTMTAWVRSGTAHNVDFNVGIEALSQAYDAICAATPTVADEGWVEHDGDVNKAPPESAIVEVQFRGGALVARGHGGDYAWDHRGEAEDIVRWRYV